MTDQSVVLNAMRDVFSEIAAYVMAGEEVPADLLEEALSLDVDAEEAVLYGQSTAIHLDRIMETDGETPLFDLTDFGQRLLDEEGSSCPTCGTVFTSIDSL